MPWNQIFNNELFGPVAEEKEVKGIASKSMEARHSKSMDSYELVARYCGKECVTQLILPLKEVGKMMHAFFSQGVYINNRLYSHRVHVCTVVLEIIQPPLENSVFLFQRKKGTISDTISKRYSYFICLQTQ